VKFVTVTVMSFPIHPWSCYNNFIAFHLNITILLHNKLKLLSEGILVDHDDMLLHCTAVIVVH